MGNWIPGRDQPRQRPQGRLGLSVFEEQKGGQSGGAEPKPNSITGKSGHKDGNKMDQNIKALQVIKPEYKAF